MDYESGDILDIRVIDKREAEYKSTNMEKMAFLQMLQLLQGKGLVVKEIVTDAHLQITALLSKYFSDKEFCADAIVLYLI